MERESSCYRNYTNQYFSVAIINTVSSLLSLLICLFVITTIILCKKYVLYTQRLALYVCLTAALWNLSTTIGAKQYFPMNDSYSYTAYCVWSGYFFQTTGSMMINSLAVISIDVYLRVVQQKNTARYEWLSLIIIFILPLFMNCIPFIGNSYGRAGAWCWIRTMNNDANCTLHLLGPVFQLSIVYSPVAIIGVVIAIFYILIVWHLYKNRYTGKYDPQKVKQQKLMLKEATPFLIYPWLFLLIGLIPLSTRVAVIAIGNDHSKILVLWGMHAGIIPFISTFAAFVFGIDTETLQSLHHACTFMCNKKKIEEYPAYVPSHTDSFQVDQNNLPTNYVELTNRIQQN